MPRTRSRLSAAIAAAVVSLGSVDCVRADTPLPTDPRVKEGELENGLRYVILRHANPPGRVSLYLHVSTGSLNETEPQRGIAHYLEHMAFNGSENFPPGTVVPLFESLGLTFGRHQNASTSFDQTIYILSLPNTEDATLAKGTLFLSDVLTRLTLPAEEIERERQVILEEKRSRLGAQQRITEQVLARIAPGSLIGDRLPIGVEETILGVQQNDFREYYSRWYVPANATIIAVGDTDEARLEAAIRAAFSGGERAPRPTDRDPMVRPYEGPFAVVVSDPEITQVEVSLVRVDAPAPPTTTEELARERLIEQIATIVFDRRMDAKVQAGEVSWLSLTSGVEDLFGAARWTQAGAGGEPGRWKDILTDLGRELQRARLHGFTDREVEDVRKQLLASAEQFARQEPTLDARFIIRQMLRAVHTGDAKLSAAQELDLMSRLLPTIDARVVSERFAALFDPAAAAFVLQIPEGAGVPTESELLRLAVEATGVSPEADSEGDRATTLMEHVPEPAAFVDEEWHEGAAVWSAWLENGVRVHHRFMDVERDTVSVSISLAAGPIEETASNRTVTRAATIAFTDPATSSLTSTDIRDLMTGKNTQVRGGVMAVDTVMLNVSGSPADLESGLQLAHLLLTSPVVEERALENWRTEALQQIEQREKDPRQAFQVLLQSSIFPDDVRLRPHTAEHVRAVSRDAAQSRIRQLVKAPMEVTIVGDLPKERAKELAARYFGTLPARERIGPSTLAELKRITRTKGMVEREKRLATQTPVALVASGFYGPDAVDIPESRAMDLAARILTTRMNKSIREERQLVYSIGAQVQADRAMKGFGVFMAAAPTAGEKAQALADALHEMYTAFAKDGPTEEEMIIARRQADNTLDESMKTARFWSGAISAMDYRGNRLDDVIDAPEAFQKITAAQVRETFAKHFTPDSTIRVMLLPAPAGG